MDSQNSSSSNFVFLTGHIHAVNDISNVFRTIEQVHNRIGQLQVRVDTWAVASEQILRMF